MARKKAGSRAAAGQAKARERARRKARVTGPSLAEAAYVPPSQADDVPDDEPEAVAAVAEAAQAAPASPAPAPVAAPRAVASPAPQARGAAAQRRERQFAGMTPTGSLKRELLLIGSITLIIAAAFAALATTTTLGA